MSNRRILLGDEAVAFAAVHAGIRAAYSYPGTPATEIFETIQKIGPDFNVRAKWSANEKTAYEEALGHSYAGSRTLVSMKHVGLNVAADPYMSSAITGANGGLVLAVADDPGMHSSQNEQDSRILADFAMMPCLEPWDQQTAYDWTREAFEISEEFRIPVTLRLVTRLSHSRSNVNIADPIKPAQKPASTNWRDWVLVPANARPNYEKLVAKQPAILERLRSGPFFQYDREGDTSIGIIACGLARNYVMEALQKHGLKHPVLAIGAYPIPDELLSDIMERCDKVLIVEDGYPWLERRLRASLALIKKDNFLGRMSGELPRTGEMTPDAVATALGVAPPAPKMEDLPLAARPPRLCDGCSHIDVFSALSEVMKEFPDGRIFGDIGCYTLGALPPYNSMASCVDMGASIGMALGAADAGLHPAVAVIGDSTFTHSGMTGLLDVISADANVTVVISDNAYVAMTGGQQDLASGEGLTKIAEGMGANPEHSYFVDLKKTKPDELMELFRKELSYRGASFLVCKRECLQAFSRDKKQRAKEAAKAKAKEDGGSEPPQVQTVAKQPSGAKAVK
jgi:indolepyruvate ferredoxin oxidoreductase, alpha subunit